MADLQQALPTLPKAIRLAVVTAVAVAATLTFLLSTSAVASASGTSASAPGKGIIGGLYNQRYCEIFAVSPATEFGFPITVYNTIGLNDCPTDIWDALDFQAIARSEGVFVAAPNGPRRWVVDAVVGGNPGPAKDLGGLMMREVATITSTSLSPPPFTVTTIKRENNWIFRKGRTIREVISPAGRRYVMQAYTNTVDPTLSLSTLNSVGANPLTEMPPGWRFRTRKLKHKLVVTAGGEAKIVRDGLRCVYQYYRLPKPTNRR
ncbi:MAG: hypothetical protein WEB05_02370 [Solirubrobacterales bacterium]